MYLTLLIVLLLLSFIIVALGFYRQEYTALGIAGFFFLFILSFVFMAGSVQYKVGVNTTNTYACLCCVEGLVVGDEYVRGEPQPGCTNENATLSIVAVDAVDVYETWDSGGATSHWVGYVLAVMSVIGMIGCFVNVGSERFGKQ